MAANVGPRNDYAWYQTQQSGSVNLSEPSRVWNEHPDRPFDVDAFKKAVKEEEGIYMQHVPAAKLEVYANNKKLTRMSQLVEELPVGNREENPLIVRYPPPKGIWQSAMESIRNTAKPFLPCLPLCSPSAPPSLPLQEAQLQSSSSWFPSAHTHFTAQIPNSFAASSGGEAEQMPSCSSSCASISSQRAGQHSDPSLLEHKAGWQGNPSISELEKEVFGDMPFARSQMRQRHRQVGVETKSETGVQMARFLL